MKPSCFIMLDGIDGSGKSTVIQAWKEYLASQGNAIFDLRDYWQEANRYPDFNELKKYDFIFSCEPTFAGVGKVIREEFIRDETNYPALAIAEAYSLDRLVLYTKIIIPALRDKKCVISDRGVSTSLCYQNALDPKLTFDILSALPGNALTLRYRPDHLVLLNIKPEMGLQRLARRRDKQDNVIFEKLDFQNKVARCFASSEYRTLFTRLGTAIHELPAADEIDIMEKLAIALLQRVI